MTEDAQTSNVQSTGPNVSIPGGEAKPAPTTVFSADAVGSVAAPPNLGRSTRIGSALDVPGARDIEDFLRRPTLIVSGSLATTDTGILWDADPFVSLVTSSIKAAKLAGVYGLRADVVLTLQVNAARFQSGRYLLGFVPSGGASVNSFGYSSYYRSHNTTIVNASQTPHVELDVATQTHACLTIPWDANAPFFVVAPGSNYPVGVGKAFLRPYVALAAASGDNTAGYSIWGHFENIQLIGAAVSQSGYSEREQKKAGIGPVESALTKISKASTILSQIPLVSAPAKTVGWTASVLSQMAHVFGWSKPNHLGTTSPMVMKNHRYLANSDGETLPEVLGVFSSNSLIPYPRVGGTQLDEMSIDYIKSIYSNIAVQTWSESDVSGTQLLGLHVNPAVMTTNVGSGVVMTPVGWLGSLFARWRGGLKFRLKLVKTEFHTGRLVLSFNPSWHDALVGPTLAGTEYVHRVIWDIRESSEIEVICPYISPELWTDYMVGVGLFSCHVLDPLIAPSTVPSSVSIIVEVAGADDLSFASFWQNMYEPWAPAVTQSGFTYHLGENPIDGTVEAAAVCAGESVKSLRCLTRIFSPTLYTNGNYISATATTDCIRVNPYIRTIVSQATSNSSPLSRGLVFGDVFDQIAQCYCMETGSMRVTGDITSAGTVSSKGNVRFWQQDTATLVPSTVAVSTKDFLRHRGIISYVGREPLDIVIPPFQRTIGRAVSQNINIAGTAATERTRSTLCMVPLDQAIDVYVSRHAADDYNCYGFVSIPAMVSNTTL